MSETIMDQSFIVIDLGTTNIKGKVFKDGKMVHKINVKAPRKLETTEGISEISLDQYYTLFRKVLDTALKYSNGETYLMFSSLSPTFVLLDNNYTNLTNLILYSDIRGKEFINEELKELMLKESGNPLDTQHWVLKLLWFKNNFNKYNSGISVADLTSYILLKLTGKLYTSEIILQSAGILNYLKRDYSYELLNFVGASNLHFPAIAKLTDINYSYFNEKRIYLIPPVTDSIASVVSVGGIYNNSLSINVGTTATVYYATSNPVTSNSFYLDFSPIDDLYYLVGSTIAAGGLIDFIMKLLAVRSYTKFENLAHIETDTPLLILPYLNGEKSPIMDPYAKGVIYGLSYSTTRRHLARATYDSIALSIAHNLEKLRELGFSFKYGIVNGGLTKSQFFDNLLSSALELELLISDADETIGDYLIAKSVINNEPLNKINYKPTIKLHLKPNPKLVRYYNKLYILYKNLYGSLKEYFRNF
jgi:xylulokinase